MIDFIGPLTRAQHGDFGPALYGQPADSVDNVACKARELGDHDRAVAVLAAWVARFGGGRDGSTVFQAVDGTWTYEVWEDGGLMEAEDGFDSEDEAINAVCEVIGW